MRLLHVLGLILAGLAVVVAAGCGGGASRSSSSPTVASPCMPSMPQMAACQNQSAATAGSATARHGKTRVYYIGAMLVDWDYAPSYTNKITGRRFGDGQEGDTYVKFGQNRIGHVYEKALYRQFTDATYTRQVKQPAWQGILGPTIHAEVGDTIVVHFKNMLPFPASIHPHGVTYLKANEGALYADGSGAKNKHDDAVRPGDSYTYRWQVPASAGPGPMDPSSVVWMYHSHAANEIAEVQSGLVGAIVITRAGMARPDGTPKDVDKEFVTYFSIVNENESLLLDQNVQRFVVQQNDYKPKLLPGGGAKPSKAIIAPDGDIIQAASAPGATQALETDPAFYEANLKHSINGYMYGNLPGLTMRKGQRVRWYMLDLGSESDVHTPHWHGNTVLIGGMRSDMVDLMPGDMMVADMQPENVGTWLFHCHVDDHFKGGMSALYTVLP